jgi:hypothetical protein
VAAYQGLSMRRTLTISTAVVNLRGGLPVHKGRAIHDCTRFFTRFFMADFAAAISKLRAANSSITGATFADLDGADIALEPKSRAENLKACAAFAGIALRRMANHAQALTLNATGGSMIGIRIGKGYQLVITVEAGAATADVCAAARTTARELKAGI